jgi:pSer/pThr/pTyr-binding forkhead associated (FHA) protein
MFVAKNEEMVPLAKNSCFVCTRHPFSEWVTCDNEIVRNHPKHEFWTQSSGLGMFVAKNEEMVPLAKNSCFVCTRHPFSEWVTCDNEIARNHPKHEFWT